MRVSRAVITTAVAFVTILSGGSAAVASPSGTGATAARTLAAAQLPPNPVDPGVPGPYQTISNEYALPDVSLPGFKVPVEMRAYVVAPRGASGKRPLVLLLHGKRGTCYSGESVAPEWPWPCPDGYTPLPSYRGYDRIQQLLASQGYVTASISANSINSQDDISSGQDGQTKWDNAGLQARSSLIRLHLSRWADWAGAGRTGAPDAVRSAPVPDMSKVLLVGHSRGGEGVSRAALDSLSPPPAARDGYRGPVSWQIRGLALIGPTMNGQNPVPDVPSMTILPSCDGDMSGLPGQLYTDATRGLGRGFALHSSVYIVGANHNYFNTEWTPGLSVTGASDDNPSYDPVCGKSAPIRLTPEHQQKVGATYVAAAAATFVAGDDRVRPLLDGSGFRAPSADPTSVFSHAVGGNRTRLVLPDASTRVSGAGGRLCEGATACGGAVHFPRFDYFTEEFDRYAVRMDFASVGTPIKIQLPAPASVRVANQVALRMTVSAAAPGTSFDVAITDSAGRRAVLGTASLTAMPSSRASNDWAQEVRMPLTNAVAAGLDLGKVAALEIVPRAGGGQGLLFDAWGWRPGLPAPQARALPRVDVGDLTAKEGDSGTVTHQVPVQVTGSGSGKLRAFVMDISTMKTTSTIVTVAPGATTVTVPVPVPADTERGGGERNLQVAVRTISGLTVGDAFGWVKIQEDDA